MNCPLFAYSLASKPKRCCLCISRVLLRDEPTDRDDYRFTDCPRIGPGAKRSQLGKGLWSDDLRNRSTSGDSVRPSTGHPADVNSKAPVSVDSGVVIMPQSSPFSSEESRIVDVKSDLSRISRDRLLAYREGRIDEAARQQFSLLEAELRNIEALASYVKAVSAAAGRELIGHHSTATLRFKELRTAGDVSALQDWLKKDLVPLVNKSEQAAYLVATTFRLAKRKKTKPFAWQFRIRE